MSTSGSVDRLLNRFISLSISSTLCQSCSRLPIKQQYMQGRFGAIRRSTALPRILAIDTLSPFLLRSYSTSASTSSSFMLSTTMPRIQRTTSTLHTIAKSRSLGTDQTKQRDASTSIAMIHCAKQNDPDQCLQHYLHLLRSQGTLPSHEALHQLARVLYNNQHLSGFSILHDTLLAYYTIHPLSFRQSRNLTYIYTMLINLIIRRPDNIIKRSSSSFTNKKQHTTAPSLSQSIPPSSSSPSQKIPASPSCHMSSSTSFSCYPPPSPTPMDVPLALSPPPPTTTAAETASTIFMEEKTATIVQLCQEMRQLGMTGTPAFYNSLLKFCVMKRDADLTWSFFHELALACPPTRHTFSILLDLTRQQKDPSGTLMVLDTMDQNGILPDRTMASTMMLILCDQQQYTDAAEFVDQLAHQCPQLVGPIYRSVLMDTLHRHYCQHGPHLPSTAARRQQQQQRRLANRKNKRRQVRMDLLQQSEQQQQQ